MLTYARVEDFTGIKKIDVVEASAPLDYRVIRDYLERATRLIDRVTRRSFFPWIQEREYLVPSAVFNLRRRILPSADLFLDADLLEATTVEIATSATARTEILSTKYTLVPWNIYPKFGIRLDWPQFWTGFYSSISTSYRVPTIFITGTWGYHDDYEFSSWVNTNTTLAAEMTDSATSFTVDDVAAKDALGRSDLAVGKMVKIGTEFMEITDITTTNSPSRAITVVRGVRGSTAAAHSSGATVYTWNVPEDIVTCCLKIASAWRMYDMSASGRAGVSDMSVGIEISLPADAKSILLGYQRSIVGQGYY